MKSDLQRSFIVSLLTFILVVAVKAHLTSARRVTNISPFEYMFICIRLDPFTSKYVPVTTV